MRNDVTLDDVLLYEATHDADGMPLAVFELPHDYSEPVLDMKIGLRELEDALLERRYDLARAILSEIQQDALKVMALIGVKKDREFC
jgi:hypothetical protein